MPLTDMECRAAKPRDKSYKLFDGDGLYLLVTSAGKKTWKLKYRIWGKEKKLSFGAYPYVSLIDAREQKKTAKENLEKGLDPSEIKREQKRQEKYNAEQTFEVVAREWQTKHYDTWSERHAKAILYSLEKEAFPEIGNIPVSKLTGAQVYDCVTKIEDRGAYEMTRRVLQRIGQVMRYAVVTERAERDITLDLKGTLKKFERGHYASIEVEDLPKLVKDIYENDTRIFKQTILAIRFMLLTFVRTKELLQATWEQFDFENAVWKIPGDRMKKVRGLNPKTRRPHIVPLSRQAIEILMQLQEKNGKREYVFPSIPYPKKPMSNATILSGLDALGYKGIMTGHGFRSLAMSTLKENLGYRHEVVDRQLAHKPKNKVDQAYDRAKFISQRTKMMQDWADHIDSLKKSA